jgi:hypothetical protein
MSSICLLDGEGRRSNMDSVFILWHSHETDDDTDAKLIGVYKTREDAEGARGVLATSLGSGTPLMASRSTNMYSEEMVGPRGTLRKRR